MPVAKAIYAGAGQTPPAELGFVPRYISHTSDLYTSLFGKFEMKSLGLDLAKSPIQALSDGLWPGLVYALLVVLLAVLYFVQQRMVAARAAVSPTMSPQQQKLMQYLPVAFAVFQVFFVTGLIVYYMAQAVLRIGQQAYITRRFYGHDESLGRQAQRAGDRGPRARQADTDGGGGDGDKKGGGGFFARCASRRRRRATSRPPVDEGSRARAKGRPATRRRAATPASGRRSGRPRRRVARRRRAGPTQSNRPSSRPGGARAKSGGKRRR